MFCHSCGAEERQRGQFCRTCGTDLRPVRTAVEKPDAITLSAVSARHEIGRAIADKIRELRSAEDLSAVAENVLPEIEKFLEAPEEKRLRRIRFGVALAALGFGVGLSFTLIVLFAAMAGPQPGRDAPDSDAMLFLAGLAFGLFLFGAGIAVNGWYFTVPRQPLPDHSAERHAQLLADALPEPVAQLESPAYAVTEHTTHSLRQPLASPRDTNRH